MQIWTNSLYAVFFVWDRRFAALSRALHSLDASNGNPLPWAKQPATRPTKPLTYQHFFRFLPSSPIHFSWFLSISKSSISSKPYLFGERKHESVHRLKQIYNEITVVICNGSMIYSCFTFCLTTTHLYTHACFCASRQHKPQVSEDKAALRKT